MTDTAIEIYSLDTQLPHPPVDEKPSASNDACFLRERKGAPLEPVERPFVALFIQGPQFL